MGITNLSSKTSSRNNSIFLCKKFVQHVHAFMDSLELINANKSVLVAVSGGVDSIALMYVLSEIFKGGLRVLHINHGTRPDNIDEENLVIKHCEYLGLEIDIVRFSLKLDQKNFEAVSRNLRAEVYKKYIKKNFLVHTAHHLDDSFEWSMIQSFKQSSVVSTLGIPVFNRGLVRPFMCVSKKQIITYAKALKLSWAEDSSNRDIRFERNFFRASLTHIISKRYPQYLYHYVARQNQLAIQLNFHRKFFINKNSPTKSSIYEMREPSGAVVLRSKDFSIHKNHIKEWIHFFSKFHRGEIDREVDKLILSHKNITSDQKTLKMKGPQSFSGGVKIFILDNYILICNDLHLDYYQKCDDHLLELLESNGVAEITDSLLSKQKNKAFFPNLCFLDSRNSSKTSKLTHPLLPKSTDWLKKRKIPYSFYPLIRKKIKLKQLHTAVILDSSALGL